MGKAVVLLAKGTPRKLPPPRLAASVLRLPFSRPRIQTASSSSPLPFCCAAPRAQNPSPCPASSRAAAQQSNTPTIVASTLCLPITCSLTHSLLQINSISSFNKDVLDVNKLQVSKTWLLTLLLDNSAVEPAVVSTI
ncbi:unnamed protein product [Urochloa humidicola]